MLNLREYHDRADRLSDHLPWAALLDKGVILNKDGSFQRSFAFRGPDLESATPSELVSVSARANNALRRFGSGWVMYFEADRSRAARYPADSFPDAASWLVDQERKAEFENNPAHYESHYFFTLQWMPPPDRQESLTRRLFAGGTGAGRRDWRVDQRQFMTETNRAHDLFSAFMPEFRELDDAETLTYLHGTISDHRHELRVPATPFYLDAILADTPLVGGLEPRLGDLHLRTITILGMPPSSEPGLLDALNGQGFQYRWVTRFIALDREEAARALARVRRHWFNKRKSVSALLREVMYNQPVQLVDSDAENKVVDSDAALQLLGQGDVAFGHVTVTVTVCDEDPSVADDKSRAVERVVNGAGFTTIKERLNAVEAWLSSLPGQAYANVRQPLVHTLNLAHLVPLSAPWAGPAMNRHLGASPLLYGETGGSTPFRLSTHVGDVGHMLIVGPTGSGKSALLSLMAMQFRRYDRAQVFLFDKGWSARAAVLAMGGSHHALGFGLVEDGRGLAFQPLSRVDEPSERAWAAEWISVLLQDQEIQVTPETRDSLWSALASLGSAPPTERTLTGLSLLLQSAQLRAALAPFTIEGPYGCLVDAEVDGLQLSDVHCFEVEELVTHRRAAGHVFSYMFHRLEDRFDGRPTLLLLDEAWLFLDHAGFASKIREWLKTLRKKNVAVVFATQSLADVSNSSIAPAIIESCPQRIFLPNATALEPQSAAAYRQFGLNDRQVEIIATATPKKEYYLQSVLGNRLFELALGDIALAYCAASDPGSRQLVERLMANPDTSCFARELLSARGLEWAAGLIDRFPGQPRPEGELQ